MIWKSEPPSIAERKRRAVRQELGEVALKLLAAHGFEGTTIDQITEAAGCSRRTFFRYFKSKEDVIIEVLSDLGDLVVTALRTRPADEPPLDAVRAALQASLPVLTANPHKSAALVRLVHDTPALHARHLHRQQDLETALTAELATRENAPPDDLRLRLTAATALKIYDLVLPRWARTNGQADLSALLDDAFTLLDGPSATPVADPHDKPRPGPG
ncbi:TetR family transcriptional regulator [Actinocorallia sp. API 0066]|uniref:TetR/AcrR family transcriptional regulator n=1 Tax=Actinocorallia sp. API 0066 TaxID=2896846 RepID=UPI001E656601|nr:TetR family transcriptional regulator [Actinocorallia sp. API 0066]MCD0449322.1 TetR family transcriptional regulator [Actinocorallia sp. API 0066]